MLGIFISLSLYIYPIATYPYITRVLQPEGLGRISFVASFVVFFTLISQLGMPIYGLRSCAKEINSKEKLQNLVAELLLVQVFSGCTALLLYGIVVLMILPFKQEPVLFFIYASNLILKTSLPNKLFSIHFCVLILLLYISKSEISLKNLFRNRFLFYSPFSLSKLLFPLFCNNSKFPKS